MLWARTALIITVFTTATAPAYAQKIAPDGVPYRTWDISTGAGLLFAERRDTSVQGSWSSDSWDSYGSISADGGYYWTDHLKSDVGVAFFSTGEDTIDEQIKLPDGRVAQAIRELHIRHTQVVIAGTYQFFENGFTHPYVAGGVRLSVLGIDSTRYPWAYIPGNYTQVGVPSDQRHSVELRARPFVALGGKSYFNERVFIRPEIAVGVNSHGLGQVGLRLGVGVDF